MRNFKDLTEGEIIKSISSNHSFSGTCKALGIKPNYSNRLKLKAFVENKKLNIEHFTGTNSDLSEELYMKNPLKCLCCGNIISWEQYSKNGARKFCSQSCSAKYNNKLRSKTSEENFCKVCGKPIGKRSTYCSNTCKAIHEREEYIKRWKNGEETGGSGEVSEYVRSYLLEENNYSCSSCGFNTPNPYTGNSILQIHHKDGDCHNNREENLEVLCPNCHALTENFGSRNKNSTRIDRRTKKNIGI